MFIVGNGDDALNLSNALVVRKDGNVGIGNINPTHRLHIVNRGESGAVPNANASVDLDDNNNQYIHFLNPGGFESAIIQGRPGSSIRAGIAFTSISNIQFRTGGNSTKLVIDSLGNIGAGNLAPLVKLEVNGALALDEKVLTLTNPSITITPGNRSYIQLNSNLDPGARELHLTDGLVSAQMLILQCTATGGFGFMVRDADANIDINGTLLLLNLNDTISFIWDGDEWVELHRSSN